MTATSRPRWRAEAATSAPIQPAPMTVTVATAVKPFAQEVGVVNAAQVKDAVELAAKKKRGGAWR